MKIGVVVHNVALSEEQLEDRRRFLMNHALERTDVVMIKPREGPISIESSFEHEQAGYYMAMRIRELEKNGYDAFITWCAEDAGLVSSRQITKIPVIGPLESSCSIAIILGHKFSIIGLMVQRAFMERKVWELGLGSRLASIRSLDIPVTEARNDLKRTYALLKRECKEAVKKDGADVVVLSCLALFGLASQLMKELKAPVIDPALAALKVAEMHVSLGLTHSKATYPFPPR
jgi:allantoin racemase